MKTTLICIFFSSILGCTGVSVVEDAESADMAEVSPDLPPLPQPGSSTGANGTDRCSTADCNTPLNKTVEFSNPIRGGMR
jgi:hypothetical protein